ncbi:MAG: hypothetical protein JXB45_11235 [Candidatus Krumholzibacteriota bacterium]|nr:hypothetical protein [Candidatus Krumholzibacteriota bacterium]
MILPLVLLSLPAGAGERSAALLIDHTRKDIGIIPEVYLESVKDGRKCHFAHTSHGGQISTGVDLIENQFPQFDHAYENCTLPDVPGAYCLFNGQTSATYITPDDYWRPGWRAGMDFPPRPKPPVGERSRIRVEGPVPLPGGNDRRGIRTGNGAGDGSAGGGVRGGGEPIKDRFLASSENPPPRGWGCPA